MEELRALSESLESIVINIKKSINRPYTQETKQKKIEEITEIIKQANHFLKIINSDYFSSDEVKELSAIKQKLKSNKDYALSKLEEIGKCLEVNKGNNSLNSEKVQTESPLTEVGKISESDNMSEKFELKTATSLLPKLDGTEESVQALIDAIEMYSEMIDAQGKALLTTFVLKTRLNSSAKLKLKATYQTPELLVVDIKKFLLTKKSPTALVTKLHNARQNNRSIENFGKEVEELFVQLTIAQADGNSNPDAYTILQETNEQIAINSFANGLKNPELKTIVKARNYKKLNEAIRAALDEEKGSHNGENLFNYKHSNNKGKRNFNKNNNRNTNFQNYRRENNNGQNIRSSGHANNNNNNQRNQYSNRRNANNRNYNNRGNRTQNVRHFSQENDNNVSNNNNNSNNNNRSVDNNQNRSNNTEENVHFFRA